MKMMEKKVKILVVDDEAIVRESIRDWLEDAGHQVATAESGEEALALVKEQDFGVMVLDLRLPGMSGIDVLKKVKQLKPQIKSIIITAYPSVLSAVEVMKLGAIDYLIKPVAPDDLEKLIKETLLKCEG
jgi:two-component system response regulator HydG